MYDSIVVGSGIAGLFTALSIEGRGGRVLVVTKGALQEGATRYAQGGIAAALESEDSLQLHESDTIAAGDGICDPETVHILVDEAARRVTDLVRFGVRFDTKASGGLAYAREAAHSIERVLHAGGDATGRHIALALTTAVSKSKITVMDETFVADLLVDKGVCGGIVLPDGRRIEAANVVIACGGAGQLFTYTTNPSVSTGDGIAVALRAGAAVTDIEFFQFHPTAFAGDSQERFLISEAVRGAGARVRNDRGEAFLGRYDERAELAPRDVVTRAIVAEMDRTDSAHVWLDATHLEAGEFQRRFPTIAAYCKEQDCDPESKLIPVSPAAHYLMGGIWTDTWGRTTLPGLYACGEAACTGVHGANRLASNSLLECVVFASRVAEDIITGNPQFPPEAKHGSMSIDRAATPSDVQPDRELLRRMMWEEVGIRRDDAGLRHARDTLAKWANAPASGSVSQLETANLVLVGWVMAEAALRRRESRGAHYRIDFPVSDPEWRHRQMFTVRDRAATTLPAQAVSTR